MGVKQNNCLSIKADVKARILDDMATTRREYGMQKRHTNTAFLEIAT